MKYKKISLILFFVALILGAGLIYYFSLEKSKIPFAQTPCIYISGIDISEMSLVKSWGTNSESDMEIYIHLKLHYRSTDTYIYDPWSINELLYSDIENIHLSLPDSLFTKLEYLWLKNGDIVKKYDKNLLEKEWIIARDANLVVLSSTSKQVSTNTLKIGNKNLLNNVRIFGFQLKLFYYIYIGILSILFIYSFSHVFKKIYFLVIKFSKKMFNKHRDLFSGIFSFFAGLIFILIILEITLRIVGYYHKKQNINYNYKLSSKTENVIVCLGDSFTEGIGSSEDNDYPAILDRMIKDEYGEVFDVLNFGQSGKNTVQIKSEFKEYLTTHTPKVVVLMAGSANYWNYYGMGNRQKFIYNIRTFKLVKLLWNSIFTAQQKKKELPNNSFFSIKKYEQRRLEFLLRNQKQEYNLSYHLSILRSSDSLRIKAYSDSIFMLDDINPVILTDLVFYSMLASFDMDFDKLKNLENKDLADFIKITQGIKQDTIPADIYSNYYISMWYFIKSLSAEDTRSVQFLKKSKIFNPYLEDAYYGLYYKRQFAGYLPKDYYSKAVCLKDTADYYIHKLGLFGGNLKKGTVYIEEDNHLKINISRIDTWVEDELYEIVNLCTQKGIGVIIMNYPILDEGCPFQPVNDVLEDIAILYNVSFINNYERFKTIDKNRDSYFVTDGHCSDIGYYYIAEEVFNEIETNNWFVRE